MKNLKQCECIGVAAGESGSPWKTPQDDSPFRDHKAGIDISKNDQLKTISSHKNNADQSGFTTHIDIDYVNPTATVNVNYIYICTATNIWKRSALTTW